ncbi:DUF3107 domain-containing protein [Galliscardovia ingluviei]|nr:DUF3107 domain-containing protein [Galliscardovia ingluviei]
MEVEIGIRDVARTVNFESNQTPEELSATIEQALAAAGAGTQGIVNLTDAKGRHIVIPAASLGYVIIGSDTTHPVGFGNLN